MTANKFVEILQGMKSKPCYIFPCYGQTSDNIFSIYAVQKINDEKMFVVWMNNEERCLSPKSIVHLIKKEGQYSSSYEVVFSDESRFYTLSSYYTVENMLHLKLN